MAEQDVVQNGLRGVGDLLMPGSSRMLDGDIKSGALHLVGGVAARLALGPVGALGWLYAAGNSYSQTTTNKPLHRHFLPEKKTEAEGDEAAN